VSVVSQFSLEPRAYPLCLGSPQCPAEKRSTCRCLIDHLAEQARGDAVATAHLLAVNDSKGVIDRARRELSSRGDALVAASSAAEAGLRRLDTFLRQERIIAACRAQIPIAARHEADGAHNRRQRLLPKRWIPDILIGLAAVFDTLFFSNLFRFLLNVDTETPWGRVATLVSYIPGAVLAFSLLITGLWLGEAVELWRIRRSGWPDAERAPRPEWFLPLGLLLLVLTTVGAAAWARPLFLQPLVEASDRLGTAPGESTGGIPTWVIVLLLLMLTVTAIATKVMARNSYADDAEAAEKLQRETQEKYTALLTTAEQSVLAHEQRWQDFRGSVYAVISDVEDLWAAAAWHHGADVTEPRERWENYLAWRLVQHTPYPPPAFGAVLSAVDTLRQYPFDPPKSKLKELTAQADEQWATGTTSAITNGDR
jgi:hypothetical protein